jgi:hypothetical protein
VYGDAVRLLAEQVFPQLELAEYLHHPRSRPLLER